MGKTVKTSSPARSAAGRANRAKRRGLTADGRERLRQAAFANQPWMHSTGPTTLEGKAKVARNGKRRQLGTFSVRELRAELSEMRRLLDVMREARDVVG
ncbi:MAG: hypothetical protein U0791_05905 [Gemmataceae bacterium]